MLRSPVEPLTRFLNPDPTVIGVDADRTVKKPKFPPDTAGFSAELRRRVDDYFASGPRVQDRWQMYAKIAVILLWLTGAYVGLVFAATTWWQAVPLAILLAGAMAAVGFNIGHDGSHSALSRRPWVNRMAAASMDLIGASSYLWKWKHVVLHHTYPNVDGHDTDLDAGPFARLSPHQPRYWFHRFQQFYLWPLYGVTAVRWHLYGDFKEAAIGAIGTHRIPRPRGWDLAVLLLGKVASIGFLIGLPMIWHTWWVVLAYYTLVACTTGLFLTVVFQLAHCVGEAQFPTPEPGTDRMADAWAVHQIQTTVDFARNSRVLSWLLGGLNFQVEHHLFPKFGHDHYPALSRIVEDVCVAYGVRYTFHPSFWGGIVSHYRWLKRMGRPEVVAVPA